MSERWLFLQGEPEYKLKNFAYSLRDSFGENFDISEFLQHKAARESRPDYSLETVFKQKGNFIDAKLVIGQPFLKIPKIRFAFRYEKIWGDFMVDEHRNNYQLVGDLFLKNFNLPIEEYPSQQVINQPQ